MSASSNFSLQRLSQELKSSGSVYDLPRRNAASLKRSKRNRKDTGTSTFTLTLLLLDTIGASQTDNPMFWLLIGPAPFAVSFTGLVFFRQRFSAGRPSQVYRLDQ